MWIVVHVVGMKAVDARYVSCLIWRLLHGKLLNVTTFGESHGVGVGCIDGLQLPLSEHLIQPILIAAAQAPVNS